MVLRVLMVTTLLLIAASVDAASELLLPFNPLYFLIGSTYALTVIHAISLRMISRPHVKVYSQVIGDLLTITGLVYITGSARPGFMLLYPISVLSASMLLYRRGGLTAAGLSALFYAALLFAVRSQLIPPSGLGEIATLPAKNVLYSIFLTSVACVTVALIGSYLSESLRNVGERLQEAAGQVADLKELNDVIVNSIHSGLLTVDGQGRIIHMNPFGERILGIAVRELKGRSISDVFALRSLEPGALALRSRDFGLSRLEVAFERGDGRSVELGVSVSQLTGAEGRGYLLVFQDLTDIKRLEGEIRTKEKLAAVGEMASHLAHEIRNPLGSISGSAQVLMSDATLSQEQEHLLGIIRKESKRLSDTLNQFLGQSRPSVHPFSIVDLGPVIAEAVTLLRNGAEVGPTHVVEFDADQGPHFCLADPQKIAQVFWNLARNGLEAMPDGGVLSIHLSRHLEEVLLSVRDQGRGIGRDEQQRIFEPFQSRTPLGTGLGLAIVYRIVREHRGDISIRSEAHEGTEALVRLPLMSTPAGEAV